MKKYLSPVFFISAAVCAVGLSAAPVNYEEPTFDYNTFRVANGKWDSAKNWTKKSVPNVKEIAIVRNNAGAEVSSNVSSVSGMHVGGTGKSALTISSGGMLEVLHKIRVGRTQANTSGMVSLEGGHLRTGAANTGGRLNVGESSTHSSVGMAQFRTGTFEGGIGIGSVLANTGVGTLSVIGSQVTAGGRSDKDTLWISPFGTLEFIFDAEGVSPLNYKDTSAGFEKGAKIRIDGTAYKGPGKTFVLVSAKKLKNEGALIETFGFADTYEVKTAFDKRGLVLNVRQK